MVVLAPRARAAARQQLPNISLLLLKKAEGGAGEAAKKLKGNFGVAFALPNLRNLFTNPFSESRGLFRAFFGLAATRGASRIPIAWLHQKRSHSTTSHWPLTSFAWPARWWCVRAGGFVRVYGFERFALRVQLSAIYPAEDKENARH